MPMLFCSVVFCYITELPTAQLHTEASIHAIRCSFSPMLPSRHHDSNCSTLQKRQSSKLLVTGEFSGVHSEQDKNASTTAQLPYTNQWQDSNLPSNHNFDCINDDVIESTRCIKTNPATITSQALCDSANITTVAVEESKVEQRQSYVVFVGSSVTTVSTKLYASLPVYNKFMVKQREQDLFGVTKVKLVLKSSHER